MFDNHSMILSETYIVNAFKSINIHADTWFKKDLISFLNKIILSLNVWWVRPDSWFSGCALEFL